MDEQQNFEITDSAINESITHEQFLTMGFSTTVCLLIVQDGQEVIGSYSPVSEKITYEDSKAKAREKAIAKVRIHLESIAKFRRAILLTEIARKKAEDEKNNPTTMAGSPGPVDPEEPAGVPELEVSDNS